MVTGDEILQAIFKILNEDATLQGSSYLNGTGKIEKGPQRRKGFVNPTVTMKIGGHGVDIENTLQDATVYVNTFVNDYDKGSANTKILSLIQGRIETLLHDADLTISGKRVFNCMLVSPHGGPLWDSKHPKEHYVSSTFRIQTIDLT